MEQIIKDAKELNKIENINKGGCGIAALTLKRKHKKVSIVQLIAGFFVEMAHIAIKVDNTIIDTTGVIKKSSLDKYNRIEEITESELISTLNNKEKWSSDFDRKNIDIISNKIKVNLNDINK